MSHIFLIRYDVNTLELRDIIYNKGFNMALANVGVYDYPSVGNIADDLKKTTEEEEKTVKDEETGSTGSNAIDVADLLNQSLEDNILETSPNEENKNILENDTESDSLLSQLEDTIKDVKNWADENKDKVKNVQDIVKEAKNAYEGFSDINAIKSAATSKLLEVIPPDVKARIDAIVRKLCAGSIGNFTGSVRNSINIALISSALLAANCNLNDAVMVKLIKDTLSGALANMGIKDNIADKVVKTVITKGNIDSDALHTIAESAIELDSVLNTQDDKISLVQNVLDNTNTITKSTASTLGNDAVTINGSEIINDLNNVSVSDKNNYTYSDTESVKEDVINSAIVAASNKSKDPTVTKQVKSNTIHPIKNDLLVKTDFNTNYTNGDIGNSVLSYTV